MKKICQVGLATIGSGPRVWGSICHWATTHSRLLANVKQQAISPC